MRLLAIVAASNMLLPGASVPKAPSTGPATSLVFSRDGRVVYAAGYRSVRVCDGSTGRSIRSIPVPLEQVHTLALSRDGRTLLAAGGTPGLSGRAVRVDVTSGEVRRTYDGGGDLVMAAALLPDGRVALGCADRRMRIYEESGGAQAVEGHAGALLAVAASPAGDLVVTAGADRTIRVWDARSLKPRAILTQHTETVNALAFRPGVEGEPVCASGSDDRTVRIWQPGIGRMVRIVRGHEGAVLAVAYSPDGRRLFSAGAEGIVREIDPDSDNIIRQWKLTSEWILALAVSPDSKRLAAGDSSGRVHIIRIDN